MCIVGTIYMLRVNTIKSVFAKIYYDTAMKQKIIVNIEKNANSKGV